MARRAAPPDPNDAVDRSETSADDSLASAAEGLIGAGGTVDRDALLAIHDQQREGDDEQQVTVTFKLLRDLDKRLDRYLVDRIPFLSRTSLQRLIDEGAVTVNGRSPKASTKLRLGDEIVAVLPPPPSNEIPAEEIPLEVLFEDADLIVVNKQDDIIVHPARGNKTGTLINALAWRFKHHSGGALSGVGKEHARPGVVHRLDRHTTGVMVAAKSDTAHWRLGKQFEQRRTEKRYLAVVHGRVEPYADVIEFPLGKHPTAREKYAVRWDESGKPSTTIYRVREVYREHTLVELDLKTGRTHQIRVHLSHLGYPIVGDDLYGGRHLRRADLAPGRELSPNAGRQTARDVERGADRSSRGTSRRGWGAPPSRGRGSDPMGGAGPQASSASSPQAAGGSDPRWARTGDHDLPSGPEGDASATPVDADNDVVIARQALHAATLSFRHPISGEPMQFQAPLPEDLRRLIQLLRAEGDAVVVNSPGCTLDLDRLMGA